MVLRMVRAEIRESRIGRGRRCRFVDDHVLDIAGLAVHSSHGLVLLHALLARLSGDFGLELVLGDEIQAKIGSFGFPRQVVFVALPSVADVEHFLDDLPDEKADADGPEQTTPDVLRETVDVANGKRGDQSGARPGDEKENFERQVNVEVLGSEMVPFPFDQTFDQRMGDEIQTFVVVDRFQRGDRTKFGAVRSKFVRDGRSRCVGWAGNDCWAAGLTGDGCFVAGCCRRAGCITRTHRNQE